MSIFFFSSRRRHTRFDCDWSSDVCSSDLCSAATFASCFYLVYAVSVELELSWMLNGQFFEFSSGAYYCVFSTFLACPDGEGGSPVALTADDPVSGANWPRVESFGPRPFRSPSDPLVLLDHFLLELG